MNNKIRVTAESLLGRQLTKKDGMKVSEIEEVEKTLQLKLPKTLRDFYLLVGDLNLFMDSFQQFIAPFKKDGMLVFLEENQGVCYWAVNAHADSETVFVCTDINSTEWGSEQIELSEFLSLIMYYQCAQGGYKYSASVDDNIFENHEQYLQFLQNMIVGYQKVVDHNGLVVYQNEQKLIWYLTDNENDLGDTIFVSCYTKSDMKKFEKLGFEEL